MKDILFYYPKHFNRSRMGTNPFFDALLEVCDRHGITYDLYEEPDRDTDKPHNRAAKCGAAFFWTITVLRKLASYLYPKRDFYRREPSVAAVFNMLTFGRFRYHNYVTISGSMYHLFSHLNPKAKVFDLQHGILYKEHPTFFDENKRLRPQYYRENLHILFWGDGYRRCFEAGDEDKMKGKGHVIGYPVDSRSIKAKNNASERTILVSLQLTHDNSMDVREHQKRLIVDFLDAIPKGKYKVLLKHHPRYNNCISIDDIFDRFPFVELTSKSLDELAEEVHLHATYSSTTAFEYASYGIPTVFFDDYDNPSQISGKFFYDEYHYPLYRGMCVTAVLARLADADAYTNDSKAVVEWYNHFYSPFDEEAFISLLI